VIGQTEGVKHRTGKVRVGLRVGV